RSSNWSAFGSHEMKTFSESASDAEIKRLVAEWSELMARKEFSAALEMFQCDPDALFTAEQLEEWLSSYGYDEALPDGARYEVTTLLGRPDADEIVETKIEVDRKNLYGLDPGTYVGRVHFDDIPLNGERSDLTARFNIRKAGSGLLTLELYAINVM
ncbi:MAG: hypothetical protein KY432_05615, partial [Acidobacteria bacterium]|nr:hypothetical protein [Acidobacteriota bacterium]